MATCAPFAPCRLGQAPPRPRRRSALPWLGAVGAVALLLPLARSSFVAILAPGRRACESLLPRQAATAAFEGKVRVTLGPYKDGAISVSGVPSSRVEDAAIDAALTKKKARKSEFVRINFTGSGARLGLTVIIEMEARRGQGHPDKGASIPGTKMKDFQLELKEDQPEPWRQFVDAIVSRGMGQMEQKTFPVTFPADYRKADFAGTTVDFTVLVREIGELRPLAPDTRPEAEQREELAAELRTLAEKKSLEALDAKLREALLSSSQVDTEAKTKSVSWAKFGPQSEQAMKWNFILEEVARVEGIPFVDVLPFLRAQAAVTYAGV
mmetsp:Transcript_19341/g.42194  ORF Transcript_19341/g.42194 Transcript_19341/m.42194 type:complete len:324 (-) Transcript_19341:63-1034(-)